MTAGSVLAAFLSLFVVGTAAETCFGVNENIYCIFGCCSDEFYVYCCLSNGAGIGIICGCLAVILSIIAAILRRCIYKRRIPVTVVQ